MENTKRKYTTDELTTLFLEAMHITLKAHAELDAAYIKAKSEINEMHNKRISSYIANADRAYH